MSTANRKIRNKHFPIPSLLIFIFSLFFYISASAKTSIEVILNHLEVPWEFRFSPEDTLFITERAGFLNVFTIESGLINRENRVRIPITVEAQGEGGLLGLALHPKYTSNHWIYIYRTIKKDSKLINQVIRYVFKDNLLKNQKVILDNIPGNHIHNGGRIAFGPDGYLYVTTGDANQPNLAQDKSSLAGKILRINDEGQIPSDNPFNSPIYSLGHRNPQGLTWDKSGVLWSTEHGPMGHDELNKIERGRNYGWPIIEGDKQETGMEKPVLHSGNDTWAPAGLTFWKNKLYFGGLRGESLYEAYGAENNFRLNRYFFKEFGRIRAVGVGPDGELYITTSNKDGRGRITKSEDDRLIKINTLEGA